MGTLRRLEEELQKIEQILNGWEFALIEYRRVFMRTDSLPMLYLKVRTKPHYLHVGRDHRLGQLVQR